MTTIPTALEAQRMIVTEIARKLQKDSIIVSLEQAAEDRWPHWWQRRLRREWAEGYRLAAVRFESMVWHSMP